MTSRIKDLVDIAPVSLPTSTGELTTYLLSYEIGDVLSRTVARLTSRDTTQPHNSLVVGGPGSGKSRLLETAAALFSADASVLEHQRLAAMKASIEVDRVLTVQIAPPESDRHLTAAIQRTVLDRLRAERIPIPDDQAAPGSGFDLLVRAIAMVPEGMRLVLFIDGLDSWLDAPPELALENTQAIVYLGELSRRLPLATCAAAGEYVMTHDSRSSGHGWIAPLLETFCIDYIPSLALRSATATNVLPKNARQRHEIIELLPLLRDKLPALGLGHEEFVELYPIEPASWTVASRLHRWIDGFDFARFAAEAAEGVKRRPAQSLFALNDLFSLYESTLRRNETLAPTFESYDRLVEDSIPRLGTSQRLWGRLALQSIFMHSLVSIVPNVAAITNSVLIYDLHGPGSSYTMMGAVLKQLETLGRDHLWASGEGTSRRYSLVTGRRDAVLAALDELADTIGDTDAVEWALLGLGHTFFADWPFGPSPAEPGRIDLWEIDRNDDWATITTRLLKDEGSSEVQERAQLMIRMPGRPPENPPKALTTQAAHWVGAEPSAEEYALVRRWLAARQLAASRQGARMVDLPALTAEFEETATGIFRRNYIDDGIRVMAERTDAVADLVDPDSTQNLVVRLLPCSAVDAPDRESDESDRTWIAALLERDPRLEPGAADAPDPWLPILEQWYGNQVGRDNTRALEQLAARDLRSPQLAEALDARQLFDTALYYVRRALSAGAITGLGEALEQIFETPERLAGVLEQSAWFERLVAWLPALHLAEAYLQGDGTAMENAEAGALRESLIAQLERPHELLDEARRKSFLDAFAIYRTKYASVYSIEHDRAVGEEIVDRLCKEVVEGPAWSVLEMLSGLAIGDQSYLVDAINLLSDLRDAQCKAPVREILERQPACTCGFRLADRGRAETLAALAIQYVQAGITHHRCLLTERREELREKIRQHKSEFDLEIVRQIADLTKEGPLPRITPQTIDAINELLESPTSWFNGSS